MNWSKKLILFTLLSSALITLTYLPGRSQNLRKIEKQAIRDFDEENYQKARDQFLILFDADWDKNMTASYLASCYLELDKPVKSYEVLSRITDPDPVNQHLMILTNFFLENFDEALMLIHDFQDTAGFEIETLREEITRAQRNYANNKGILIQNFGDNVNSEDLEFSSVMYKGYNKLLFTSRKEDGSATDIDGLPFENIYYTELDSTDKWKEATPFNVEVEERRSHDATVQFFDSGDKMILYHDGQLYTSTLKDGVWSKDETLELHDAEGSDTHCFIASDEKNIFFASDYLSAGQHLDLFVSHKEINGNWSEPKPLTIFNTESDEDAPFLASDSTFYFSSRGHDSMGGYDVFKSTYDPVKQEWGEPENMGYPINTVADDLYYTTEGKLGYLSSNRLGGYGSLDLYRVFLFNRVKVQGRLLDNKQQPISDAEIDIKYETTTLKSYTDENGDYELFVPINSRMHISFIKDSLNLIEGDYIASVSFKDGNDNEFNFLIDYASTQAEMINGNKDDQVVRHLNIDIKNDQEDNPIIASVAAEKLKNWTDSLNHAGKEKQRVRLANREVSYASKKSGEHVDIHSRNLRIRDAQILNNYPTHQVAGGSIETFVSKRSGKGTYTVQILAMSRLKPDMSYFGKIDSISLDHKDGKDGFNRFFVGEYESKEDALKAMRVLRRRGYSDAFIRRLDKYSEL